MSVSATWHCAKKDDLVGSPRWSATGHMFQPLCLSPPKTKTLILNIVLWVDISRLIEGARLIGMGYPPRILLLWICTSGAQTVVCNLNYGNSTHMVCHYACHFKHSVFPNKSFIHSIEARNPKEIVLAPFAFLDVRWRHYCFAMCLAWMVFNFCLSAGIWVFGWDSTVNFC